MGIILISGLKKIGIVINVCGKKRLIQTHNNALMAKSRLAKKNNPSNHKVSILMLIKISPREKNAVDDDIHCQCSCHGFFKFGLIGDIREAISEILFTIN